MPEAVAEPPVESSQSPMGNDAISAFTSEMAQTVSRSSIPAKESVGPDAEAQAETPDSPPESQQPPKTEKATESKPAEAKPVAAKEKKMEEWTNEDFDAAMKKAPSKAWKVYDYYKNKAEAKIKDLESKIGTVQAKPVETPADAKRIEAYEKQIKELNDSITDHRRTISELDYSRSDEFKRDYTERLTTAYQAAVEEFKQLQVTEGENPRPATKEDFDLLLALPVREQILRAKQMLGDTAEFFFSKRNEIQGIQRNGREALARARENAQKAFEQKEAQTKEQGRLYESTLEAERGDLRSNMPDYFGDTDNQEAAAAYEKGIAYAKRALTDRDKMSPQERASHDAVMSETHAAFRRMVVEQKAMQGEIDTLKAELEKYRASDPGNAGGKKTAAAGPKDDDVGGIEAMASKFQRAY